MNEILYPLSEVEGRVVWWVSRIVLAGSVVALGLLGAVAWASRGV